MQSVREIGSRLYFNSHHVSTITHHTVTSPLPTVRLITDAPQHNPRLLLFHHQGAGRARTGRALIGAQPVQLPRTGGAVCPKPITVLLSLPAGDVCLTECDHGLGRAGHGSGIIFFVVDFLFVSLLQTARHFGM